MEALIQPLSEESAPRTANPGLALVMGALVGVLAIGGLVLHGQEAGPAYVDKVHGVMPSQNDLARVLPDLLKGHPGRPRDYELRMAFKGTAQVGGQNLECWRMRYYCTVQDSSGESIRHSGLVWFRDGKVVQHTGPVPLAV